jgi:hypothetical protein
MCVEQFLFGIFRDIFSVSDYIPLTAGLMYWKIFGNKILATSLENLPGETEQNHEKLQPE